MTRHYTLNLSVITALGFAMLPSGVLAQRPVPPPDPYKAQLEALRKSLEKYQDYKVAVRDLYLSTVGCVHYSGEKIPDHME